METYGPTLELVDIINETFARQVINNTKEIGKLKQALAALNLELGILQNRFEQHIDQKPDKDIDIDIFDDFEDETEEK